MRIKGKQGGWGEAFRWCIYDLGHTGFTMIVLAVLFPILYQEFWAGGLEEHQKTSFYSISLGVASVCVAILSPVLAVIAQAGGLRMRFFRVLCALGILGMVGLSFVGEGQWGCASVIYILSALGFFGANLFYDSFLVDVSTGTNRDTISGIAFSIGYLGGVLLLGVIAIWTQYWSCLGLREAPDPRLLFAFGAGWWLVFAFPLLLKKEKCSNSLGSLRQNLRRGLSVFPQTCRALWQNEKVRWFILAYFFYIDGVHTIITSAIRYGKALGFEQGDLFFALLIVQIFGIPFALIFGFLGRLFGAKLILLCALVIYCGVAFYAALMEVEAFTWLGFSISPMFVLAALIGMIQGGVQALSRSYFASIIPAGQELAFFGFYSMIGRCSTILGPFLLSFVAFVFHDEVSPLFSTRVGIATISFLFVIGGIFLFKNYRRA